MNKKICLTCSKEFHPTNAQLKNGRGKFCSFQCYWKDKKGKPTGRANYIAYGKNNPAWKGKDVGYVSLHKWVARKLGKANNCSFNSSHLSWRFEWANISGSYLRNINDWTQLCIKCHRDYDMIRSGYSRFGRSIDNV